MQLVPKLGSVQRADAVPCYEHRASQTIPSALQRPLVMGLLHRCVKHIAERLSLSLPVPLPLFSGHGIVRLSITRRRSILGRNAQGDCRNV